MQHEPPSLPPLTESRAIALIGAVQFVNVLDFMMVMPLGPDLATALGIDTAHIGLIGGSYTAAAAVSGILGSFVLDRFDRRTALGLALLGLALGTAAGAFAVDLPTLLAARIVAGLFGGPATAIGVAVIADIVPIERRGSAMGKVMGAFSVASVFGVPFGLELASRFDFRAPFFAVGGLGLLASVGTAVLLPSMRAHLERARTEALGAIRFDLPVLLTLASSALIMIGNFSLIPNFSAYIQYNLGYPRSGLGMLYLVGGIASFFAMRLTGRLVDRFGSARVVTVGTGLYVTVCTSLFYSPILLVVPALAFAMFMTANATRFVPLQSLASRVPTPDQRARFLSTQSAVQHFASSIGAMGATRFLVTTPDGKLHGLEQVALVAVALAAVVPFFTFVVERRVRAREDSALAHAKVELAAHFE